MVVVSIRLFSFYFVSFCTVKHISVGSFLIARSINIKAHTHFCERVLKAPKNVPCAVSVIWRHLASSPSSFNIHNDVGRHRHRHKSVINRHFKVWWCQAVTSFWRHQIVIFIQVVTDADPWLPCIFYLPSFQHQFITVSVTNFMWSTLHCTILSKILKR